jgi:hypothetical protein
MFDPYEKLIGTGYTSTVALLAVAFVFIPGALFISHPVGYVVVSLAVLCSALCVTFAWANWKKSSQLTMPSIVTQRERSK